MITLYDQESGKIQSIVSGDPPSIAATKENTTSPWVDGGFHWDNYYVLDGVAVPRPVNPAVLSGPSLLNVPVPAEVIIGASSYQTNESTVTLEFNMPGTYKVKVVSFPYLDAEFEIENPTP